MGNLGSALANYSGFGGKGFVVAGLFDADHAKTGTRIHGIVVEPLSRLAAAVEEREIDTVKHRGGDFRTFDKLFDKIRSAK